MAQNTRFTNKNQTATPLAAAGVFTGSWENAGDWASSVTVAVKTDQAGTLELQLSPDGTNLDSSLTYDLSAGVNEVHRLTLTRRYFRAIITNTAASPQTYLRVQTLYGEHQALASPLNLTIQQDTDAITARTIDTELSLISGLMSGYDVVNKVGKNSDVDTGTVPEDVWEGGGVYTGWATAAQTLQVFSSAAADAAAGTGARTVRVIGLDANYAVLSETVTLNGVTPVLTTGSFLRVHTARVMTAGSGGVNAGVITVRQSTTTTNVFIAIVIGINQSNSAAYTVPAGKTAYMRRLHASIRGGAATANVDGGIWVRDFNGVFRQRRPFTVNVSESLKDDIYGGLIFSEKTDIIIRITACTNNNSDVVAGYDLILVDN